MEVYEVVDEEVLEGVDDLKGRRFRLIYPGDMGCVTVGHIHKFDGRYFINNFSVRIGCKLEPVER